MEKPRLSDEERNALLKVFRKEKLTEEEKEIAEKAREKDLAIKNWYRENEIDVYVAGLLDVSEFSHFDSVEELFEHYGYNVYSPASFIDSREGKGEMDFLALRKARVLLAKLKRGKNGAYSLGTSLELGYYLAAHENDDGVVILYYEKDPEGKDIYKGDIHTYDYLKYFSPVHARIHVTDSIETAIKDVLAHLEGKAEYEEVLIKDEITGEEYKARKCKICGTVVYP
ncbi:MAG: hypothetical protein J7K83_00470 [Candidatus Aenigmarchaeota archaeon]|nr:hypothetical protein [Candidatus Aenigmarchaeota archaeon]